MNAILNTPLELRLLAIAAFGALYAGLINWAIYSLAYAPRRISPWSDAPEKFDRRSLLDRIPFVGWLRLRREAAAHGAGFWIRPLVLEIGMALFLAWLYWWEVDQKALLIEELANWIMLNGEAPGFQTMLHQQYVAHVLLIGLMTVASMIDVDEKIIPDTVTIPGTLLGLTLAAAWPASLLPSFAFVPAAKGGGQLLPDFLRLTSPNDWPASLDTAEGLAYGLVAYLLWCFALLPRPWRTRHGYRRAMGILLARIRREPYSLGVLLLAVLGTVGIGLVWSLGGLAWQGLLTALVGMGVGGGVIWMVRIVGSAALHKEAMGFGDVTLMAMIGTMMGWQASLLIFFLAPLAGLVIGVLRWIFVRDHEIPYGPFLCLATLGVLVYWSPIWRWALDIFSLGWLVPIVMVACLALMGVMLAGWSWLASRFDADR